MIESKENERVKNVIKLQDKKYRDSTDTFMIEGDHLLKEALKMGLVKEIYSLSNEVYEAPTFQVSESVMKTMSNQVSSTNLLAICHKIPEKKIKGNVLVLDDIQDPGNLGTMIRSAVAFGIPNILLSDHSVDVYNPKVIRSTEGMIFHVNIIRGDIVNELKELKKENYQIIGSDVTGGIPIEKLNSKSDIALVIGSEGKGISKEVREVCESFVYIPMNAKCESLNASISASIFMYELAKDKKHE